MSRNDTIELLNETDQLGYRLAWQLFQFDNERVVYGDGSGWQPGDPLFTHPSLLGEEQGNFVRQIIETHADHNFEDFHFLNYVKVPICLDCFVAWEDFAQACWNCGNFVDEPLRFTRGYVYPVNHGPMVVPRVPRGTITGRRVMRQPEMQVIDGHIARITRIYRDFGVAALDVASQINEQFVSALRNMFDSIERESSYTWFDVETFDFPAERDRDLWWRVNTAPMRGLTSRRLWIDEWISEVPSKEIDVTTKSGVRITIPRDWRQTKTPPVPQSTDRIITSIVTQHRRAHPTWYGEEFGVNPQDRWRTT
jgi:hypothetical protein